MKNVNIEIRKVYSWKCNSCERINLDVNPPKEQYLYCICGKIERFGKIINSTNNT